MPWEIRDRGDDSSVCFLVMRRRTSLLASLLCCSFSPEMEVQVRSNGDVFVESSLSSRCSSCRRKNSSNSSTSMLRGVAGLDGVLVKGRQGELAVALVWRMHDGNVQKMQSSGGGSPILETTNLHKLVEAVDVVNNVLRNFQPTFLRSLRLDDRGCILPDQPGAVQSSSSLSSVLRGGGELGSVLGTRAPPPPAAQQQQQELQQQQQQQQQKQKQQSSNGSIFPARSPMRPEANRSWRLLQPPVGLPAPSHSSSSSGDEGAHPPSAQLSTSVPSASASACASASVGGIGAELVLLRAKSSGSPSSSHALERQREEWARAERAMAASARASPWRAEGYLPDPLDGKEVASSSSSSRGLKTFRNPIAGMLHVVDVEEDDDDDEDEEEEEEEEEEEDEDEEEKGRETATAGKMHRSAGREGGGHRV